MGKKVGLGSDLVFLDECIVMVLHANVNGLQVKQNNSVAHIQLNVEMTNNDMNYQVGLIDECYRISLSHSF